MAQPIFCPQIFTLAKVKARPDPAHPENEMNVHYKQFVLCFLENTFSAKTSMLEITAVAISLQVQNEQQSFKSCERRNHIRIR